jgi:hypothetical protein
MLGYTSELVSSQADGTALSNTTTATSILSGQSKLLIPGGFLQNIGQELIVEASGRISTVVTTPGTLTFAFRLGPTANIAVATSPAFALNIVAKTNVTWWLRWALTVRALGTGTAANLMHTGFWASEGVIGSPVPGTGGSGLLLIPASAPAVGTGFDSTIDNLSDLFATWSVANAANSIQVHQYRLCSQN